MQQAARDFFKIRFFKWYIWTYIYLRIFMLFFFYPFNYSNATSLRIKIDDWIFLLITLIKGYIHTYIFGPPTEFTYEMIHR